MEELAKVRPEGNIPTVKVTVIDQDPTEELMHCEQTAESLPWLLNGTLDAEEARRVREHLAGCSDCREALRQTRTVWALQEGHLPVETIVDYALGGFQDPDLDGLVERHLKSCDRCSAEVDGVRRNPQPSAVEIEEDLRYGAVRGDPASGRATAWRYAALAATLAALLVGVGWLRSEWQRQELTARIAQLSGPQINIPWFELLPSTVGAVLRGEAVAAGERNETAIPPEATIVWLRLLSGESGCGARCAVEVLTDQGQAVWSTGGLVPDEFGHLTFALPRSYLPTGEFTIHVFDPDSPDQVVQYVLETRVKSP